MRSAVSIGVSMSSRIPNQIREAPILKNGTDKSPLSTGEQVMPTGRSLPEIPLYGPTGDRSSSFAASASSDYGACACRFSPARDVDCAPSWRSSQRTETSYSHISYITTRPERGFMRTVSGRIFSMAALLAGLTQDTALTTNLFDVYIQYKKDTRDIVSWLLSHHPTKGAGVRKRISVRDLIAIAECICAEAMDMPEVIAFQFRQAITARNYLSKAFRRVSKADGEPSSTENHEFFTSRYGLPIRCTLGQCANLQLL